MTTHLPERCPRCESIKTLFINEAQQLACSLCGYTSKEPFTPDDSTKAKPKRELQQEYEITGAIIHPEPVTRWARSAYNSGLAYMRREKYDEAEAAFRRALQSQRDFVDARLWLARLTENEAEKHEHLSVVLGFLPHHEEAIREMMVMNGQITREEAQRSKDKWAQNEHEAPVPVAAQTQDLECPQCGGHDFAANPQSGKATCKICGHVIDIATYDREKGYGMQSMTMALIERRGKAIQWVVGDYILVCHNCGAERIMSENRLRSRCPFCGSDQVIQQDAFGVLQQPDGVIPFRFPRKHAQNAIQKALSSRVEKLKGIFVNNTVERAMLNGVYVPFWVFDVTVQIARTREDKGSQKNYRQNLWSIQQTVQREEFGDVMHDVPIAAVQSPPPRLLERLGRFDLQKVVAYDPRFLAQHTAEIYTVDYEDASQAVRPVVSDWMQTKHGQIAMGDVEITVRSMVKAMTFRLVLMPVWVATLQEADGDIRLGLVHGQTGKAVLSKARKPE